LQLNVPIFTGGTTSSRVKQAVHEHRAARERAQRIARETERLTRDSYLGVLTEISRTKALQQALRSSETALEATLAGFDVGTRTTVDVLDAQRNVFNARTQFLRARYDYLLNVLRLKQAAGSLQVQDLETINQLLTQ
ncbi:MAG: TolC family protein, partial [Pseudomonadota bacterium]